MQSYLVYICTRVGSRERNLTSLFRYQDGHWPSHAGARCDGGQSFDWRDDLPAAHDTGLTEVPVWVTGMLCCVFSPNSRRKRCWGFLRSICWLIKPKGLHFQKFFGTELELLEYRWVTHTGVKSCKIEIIMCVFWSYLSEKTSDMAWLRPYKSLLPEVGEASKHHSQEFKGDIFFR